MTPGPAAVSSLLIAGVCGLLAWRHGWTPTTLVSAAFAATAVPLAVIDAQTRRLPNLLVLLSGVLLLGTAVAITITANSEPAQVLRGLVGAAALMFMHLALYSAFAGQLGGGDVKLALPLGFTLAWHGWTTLATGVLLGWLLAAAYAIARRATRGASKQNDLPLAPFLVFGAVVVLLVGAWA